MQPAPPSPSSPCSGVLQDTNLVSHILSLILEGADLTVVERGQSAGSAASHRCKWALRGCRLGMMRRINTTWYLLLCRNTTSRLRIRSLTVLCACDPWHGLPRPNTDPYDRPLRGSMSESPWSPDALLGELHFLQPTESLSLPSLGNCFSYSQGVAEARGDEGGEMGERGEEGPRALLCMDRGLSALASAHTLDVQSLSGLWAAPTNPLYDRRALPPSVRRLRIHSVGHTGLLHCEVVRRLLLDAQERLMARSMGLAHVLAGCMADLGGIEDLEILAPLCPRVEHLDLADRLEFYFPGRVAPRRPYPLLACREVARAAEVADQSIRIVAQAILQRTIHRRDMVAVPPQCMPSAGGLDLHASLGSLYLGCLDMHGLKRIRLRAYACMGVPHCLTGTRMGLRRQGYRYHPDTKVNDMIAHEERLVLPHLMEWRGQNHHAGGAAAWAAPLMESVHGSYFPGIMSVISMAYGSNVLEEVVYTGVRSELVNDAVAQEVLVQPWRLLAEQQRREGHRGAMPALRVYVEGVQWALGPPVGRSNESYTVSNGRPMDRLLLYTA